MPRDECGRGRRAARPPTDSGRRAARRAGGDDVLEVRRVAGDDLRRRGELTAHDRVEGVEVARAVERPRVGGELVQRHAEREQVGAAVERAAARLLRRHVRDLALELTARRPRQRRLLDARDAEVDELDRAVEADQEVAGRDVAVDEVEPGVRPARVLQIGERARRAVGDRDRDRERHQPVARLGGGEQAAHVVTVDELHHVVASVVIDADVEHRRDVGVVKRRGEPRLLDEHVDEATLVRDRRQQPLDRDALVDRAVARPREVDVGHAAGAEVTDDLVATDPRTRSETDRHALVVLRGRARTRSERQPKQRRG